MKQDLQKLLSTNSRKSDYILYIFLCIISFLFLAIFSYCTSPFTTCDNGTDAAFFRLVGQGMTKGLLPYRNFFDMKGPLLFFIEWFGQIISYGRLGIFIVQCINLFLILLISCKIFEACNICNRLVQVLLLFPVLFVASFTFDGGNMTEEFSLIPLFSCLYICIIFFRNSETTPDNFWQSRIFWLSGFWYGFCFGLILMIRITNAALICACVLVIIIYLIVSHKLYQILICAGMFFVGLGVSCIPILVFYERNGLLSEMLRAVFVLGFKYSSEKSIFQHLMEAILSPSSSLLLLIAIPCIIPILLRWRGWREKLLALLGSFFTFVAIASGNNFIHYYTLTLPLIVLCEIPIAEHFLNIISANNKVIKVSSVAKTALVVILSAIMYLSQIPIFSEYISRAYDHLFRQDTYNIEQIVRDISSKIPEEDKDSVFCYNIEPYWYTYADLFPCIKYCGWHNHYISLMPEISNEMQELFLSQPPSWLILPERRGKLPSFLENEIDDNYILTYKNEQYILYHHCNS